LYAFKSTRVNSNELLFAFSNYEKLIKREPIKALGIKEFCLTNRQRKITWLIAADRL